MAYASAVHIALILVLYAVIAALGRYYYAGWHACLVFTIITCTVSVVKARLAVAARTAATAAVHVSLVLVLDAVLAFVSDGIDAEPVNTDLLADARVYVILVEAPVIAFLANEPILAVAEISRIGAPRIILAGRRLPPGIRPGRYGRVTVSVTRGPLSAGIIIRLVINVVHACIGAS
jgi:hypothetical protein